MELNLDKLKEKGLKCNIENYFFGHTEIEYLSLWVTHYVVKPTNKKIEAIKNMNPTNSPKEVRNFIGVVNCYRNMWERRSHTLADLTKITSNKVLTEEVRRAIILQRILVY